MLLLGQAGAFRRCELVALDAEDLTFGSEGIVVRVRHGKTATELAPELKGIPRGGDPALCPVTAVKAWLIRAHLAAGPLFRPIDRLGRIGKERLAGRAVARILRRAALPPLPLAVCRAPRPRPGRNASGPIRCGRASSPVLPPEVAPNGRSRW